ncbi:MAG: trxA [Holophagaceae bacterium]|nr:trxA [Holophagaceae bacterium]
MVTLLELKRVAIGVLLGGAIGFAYQKLVGCRTGTCPLTATPLRAITYGAVMGLLFALSACSRNERAKTVTPLSSTESHMSASNVIHLTTGAFDKVKAQDKPVLIDFWAPWCGPCRTQGPILDQVSSRIGDKAIVAKVNVDEEPGLAAPFGVQAIPTLVILKGGKVVQRFTGVQQAETLIRALEK